MNAAARTEESTSPAPVLSWHEANQRYLVLRMAALRARLEGRGANGDAATRCEDEELAATESAERLARAMEAPPALEFVARAFELSDFETDLLMLATGVELDSNFAALVVGTGDSRASHVSFGLALAVLKDAHWSALSPARPLRRWRLVDFSGSGPLTGRGLQIEERVLHYLTGVESLEPRLTGVLEERAVFDEEITESQGKCVSHVVAAWHLAAENRAPLPVVHLQGSDASAKRGVARAACIELGIGIVNARLPAATSLADEAGLASLVTRELRLGRAALFLDCEDVESDPGALVWATRLVERIDAPVFVSSRQPRWATRRPSLSVDVEKPSTSEQRALWTHALGADAASPVMVESLVSHFDLGARAIRSAALSALAKVRSGLSGQTEGAVWEACREQARPRLDDLAQRIEATAVWDDLVLPAMIKDSLRQIAIHVAQRARVHETWPFTRKGNRGLGVTALFAGASGTGKTLAAEVLARELGLDVYRVDLSQVVSKYIGETEKNLRRVFEAAEEAAVVLLFDEADALFGKRSDVKDSHDRYANIEVSYLLQRMETYRGLAILTTNMKSALDPAFLRRLQFTVQFPFPDAEQRLAIWMRFFPSGSPAEGLDFQKLAHMNVAGGNIYNIARNAAFLAAHEGRAVRMEHILRAAQGEFAKLERPLSLADR